MGDECEAAFGGGGEWYAAEVKEILQSGELNIYNLEDGESEVLSDRYVRTRRAGEVVVGGVNAGGESRGSENNLEFGEDELVFAKHEALGVLGMFEALCS